MPDDPGNLILVYLRQLDAKVDQVIETVTDHGRPLGDVCGRGRNPTLRILAKGWLAKRWTSGRATRRECRMPYGRFLSTTSLDVRGDVLEFQPGYLNLSHAGSNYQEAWQRALQPSSGYHT